MVEKERGMFKAMVMILMVTIMGLYAADDSRHSQEKIDQMLAPIALYPDALLSQVLMATTYDEQLQEAIGYSKANPDEKGDEAVKKVQDRGWDASVASLVAFPDVLSMLGSQPEWSKQLGEAFLAEPEMMMDRIQSLRKQAKEAGNLKSSKEQEVKVSDANQTTVIEVLPASPQTVYVPVYDPRYVYGPWMYPAYPPFYYYPPYYHPMPGFVFGFSVGIFATNAMWGGLGWYSHSVHIDVNRYNKVNVNKIDASSNRVDWHRHDRRADKSRSRELQRQNAQKALGKKGVDLSSARSQLSGKDGDRLRQELRRERPGSSSHAFSGMREPSRAHLEAERGSHSRSSSRSRSSHGGSFEHGGLGGGGFSSGGMSRGSSFGGRGMGGGRVGRRR